MEKMEDKMELSLDELEDVSGGRLISYQAYELLKWTKTDPGCYNDFMDGAAVYVAELRLPSNLKYSEATTIFLESVYPKMAAYCRSNPKLSYLSDRDVYNLVEFFAKPMYVRYLNA